MENVIVDGKNISVHKYRKLMQFNDVLRRGDLSRNEIGKIVKEEGRIKRNGKPINPHDKEFAIMHTLCPLLEEFGFVIATTRKSHTDKKEYIYHLTQKGLDALERFKDAHGWSALPPVILKTRRRRKS